MAKAGQSNVRRRLGWLSSTEDEFSTLISITIDEEQLSTEFGLIFWRDEDERLRDRERASNVHEEAGGF